MWPLEGSPTGVDPAVVSFEVTATDAKADGAQIQHYILWNSGIFGLALVIWVPVYLREFFGRQLSEDTESIVEHNSSYSNYVWLLRILRNLFICLSIVDAAILSCCGDVTTMACGLWKTRMSLLGAKDWKEEMSAKVELLILVLALVNGIITLIFIWIYFKCLMQSPLPDAQAAKQLGRTLWLQWLPTGDRRRHFSKFALTNDDLHQVSSDLRMAFEEALHDKELADVSTSFFRPSFKMTEPRGVDPVDKVVVVPVVADLISTSIRLRDWREKLEVYKERSMESKGRWRRWWFDRRVEASEKRIERLRARLLMLHLGRKQLSGSAFVMFRTAKLRNKVMELDQPSCPFFLCRRRATMSYFTFGRPPFSSVTLRCELSPHPDDLIWENMHIGWWQRQLRFWSLAALLTVGLAMGVTPVLDHALSKLTEAVPFLPQMFRHIAAESARMKAWVLLFVNTVILPECLYYISIAERTHRMSKMESRQFHLNLAFMALNLAGLGLLGGQEVQLLNDYLAGKSSITTDVTSLTGIVHKFVEFIADRWAHSEGCFVLPYLLSATFLSNAMALLAQLWVPALGQVWAFMFAVTPRDYKDTVQPQTYAWGYYQAYCVSIFLLALWMSPLIPGVLPVCALFFALRARIDQYNLKIGVYNCGSEDSGRISMTVTSYLYYSVAYWWLFLGVIFLSDSFKAVSTATSTVGASLLFSGGFIVFLVNIFSKMELRWWAKVGRRFSSTVAGSGSTWGTGRISRVLSNIRRGAFITPSRPTFVPSLDENKKRSCDWDVMGRKDVIWPDKEVNNLLQMAIQEPDFAEVLLRQLQSGALTTGTAWDRMAVHFATRRSTVSSSSSSLWVGGCLDDFDGSLDERAARLCGEESDEEIELCQVLPQEGCHVKVSVMDEGQSELPPADASDDEG